jgi:hypothetical protein
VWSPTRGVSLESLVRWTAPNGGVLEAEIQANGGPSAALAGGKANGSPAGSRKTSGVRRI